MNQQILLQKIDIAKSKTKPYRGFVFLCGGPTDVTAATPISIRDAICRALATEPELEERIRIAEHFKDWSKDAVYRDLVLFETHLAELSSVVVLVLESPGSIAELGLFSVIPEFHKKLLVIIESSHYKARSFIRLGPVDFLEKSHDNIAECHQWFGASHRFDSNLADELQPDLAEAIRGRAAETTPEHAFKIESWLDCALLVCDLLGLCSALTIRELRELLVGFGYSGSEADVRQTLFLLEQVGLIKMEPNGVQRFYINNASVEFIKFHVDDISFDLQRFRADVLNFYERKDRKRYRAILAARQ